MNGIGVFPSLSPLQCWLGWRSLDLDDRKSARQRACPELVRRASMIANGRLRVFMEERVVRMHEYGLKADR